MGVGFTLANTFQMFMDSLKIEDYKEQLEQVCVACNKYAKCKHKKDICYKKRMLFMFAKRKYKKKLKKEELNESS